MKPTYPVPLYVLWRPTFSKYYTPDIRLSVTFYLQMSIFEIVSMKPVSPVVLVPSHYPVPYDPGANHKNLRSLSFTLPSLSYSSNMVQGINRTRSQTYKRSTQIFCLKKSFSTNITKTHSLSRVRQSSASYMSNLFVLQSLHSYDYIPSPVFYWNYLHLRYLFTFVCGLLCRLNHLQTHSPFPYTL